MKLTHCLLFVFLLNASCLLGQGLYVKAGSNFHISTERYQMPRYFDFGIQTPSSTGIGANNVNVNNNEFSVASGFNFQGAVGYAINDFLSVEMKISTFSNFKREIEASPRSEYGLNGETEWNLRSYSLLPTIYLGHSFGKSSMNIFVFTGAGFNQLNIVAYMPKRPEEHSEYEFDQSWAFSWGYGLEYSYSVNDRWSLFTNIGFNYSHHFFNHAKLISSSMNLDYLTAYQKEIEYVNEILNVDFDYRKKPERRLKETLKLNSVFLGVGVKRVF